MTSRLSLGLGSGLRLSLGGRVLAVDPPVHAPAPLDPSVIPSTASLLAVASPLVSPPDGEPFLPTNTALAATPVLDARETVVRSNEAAGIKLGTNPHKSKPPCVALIGGKFSTSGDPTRVHDWWYREFGNGGHLMDCMLPPWVVIDGARLDNCVDGIGTRSQYGYYDSTRYEIRNVWLRNCHDDAIENDQWQSVTVKDTLIEEAFVGISMRKGSPPQWNGTGLFRMERSLLGVGMQPIWRADDTGGIATKPAGTDVNGDGCVVLLKLLAGSCPLALEFVECVFFMPAMPWNGSPVIWPRTETNVYGAPVTFTDCVFVWGGSGAVPGAPLPDGIVSTTDVGVWTDHVASWKSRHGVTDFDTVDMVKMLNPDPWVPPEL